MNERGQHLDKNRLRDLILHFYTVNDPERLQSGIDINGMVLWALDVGLVELNKMLESTYGKTIDYNDRAVSNQLLVQSVSIAVSGRPVMDLAEMRKYKIADMLKKFYKKHDKNKLGTIFKLTEYALFKGENALNVKLKKKYGEDLTDFEDDISSYGSSQSRASTEYTGTTDLTESKEATTQFTAEDKTSKTPLQHSVIYSESNTEKQSLTPIGEQPLGQIEEDLNNAKEKLEAQLIKFYHRVDPSKLVVLEALVLWALQIGRKEYNMRLQQLYGQDLDTQVPMIPLIPVSDKGSLPDKNQFALNPSDLNKTDEENYTTEVEPIKSKSEAQEVTTTPIVAKPIKQSKRRKTPRQYRPIPVPVWKKKVAKKQTVLLDLYAENMGPENNVCDNYSLDMTSKFFGVCKCGHKKTAHGVY